MTETINALEGIRIIDFSHVYQGPVGMQILADFGADVIKIERPGSGDWSRAWGPYVDGMSLPYASLNRNKRSLALNLKHEKGIEIILKLVETADVLVHNFRPGVMARLGLDYETVHALNPRLIYALSSGWGDVGPYVERSRGGHDMLARAEAGWFETLSPNELPVPAGISADYPAGLTLVQGILIALLARAKTGEGQLVTTDLLSVAFHARTWDSATVFNADRPQDDSGIGVTEAAIKKSFRTQDGMIELSPVFSANFLKDISTAMNLGDLCADPRFDTVEKQLVNSDELNGIIAARFLTKTTNEWLATLEPQGILCGRINTFEEATQDPQIAANEMIIEMEHPRAGRLRLLGTPLRLYGTPATFRQPPAYLGEQSAEVIADLGYSPKEIDAMRDEGVFE